MNTRSTDTDISKAPPEAPAIVASLLALGGLITAIEVQYRMTGADTADTWIVLTGWPTFDGKPTKKFEARDNEVLPFLDIKPDYNSIAKVKKQYSDIYYARREYEKKHKAELAELHRLQKKFGVTS